MSAMAMSLRTVHGSDGVFMFLLPKPRSILIGPEIPR